MPQKANYKKYRTKETVRLNKIIAASGTCSRREADHLIASGVVKVNGKLITEMGFQVKPNDKVTVNDNAVQGEKKVYILLNKPKDVITTTDDPQGRKTVLDLIEKAGDKRVYPVGRLDRNTTGLLLLTNDGDLSLKLTHPKYQIRKIYEVKLDKGFKEEDLNRLVIGIELEDGMIKTDKVSYLDQDNKTMLGVEIHSGRNRIIRRIFEHLGYEVIKLDRVSFAGLTKKKLPRGRWRFLTPKEVSFLKMEKSYHKDPKQRGRAILKTGKSGSGKRAH